MLATCYPDEKSARSVFDSQPFNQPKTNKKKLTPTLHARKISRKGSLPQAGRSQSAVRFSVYICLFVYYCCCCCCCFRLLVSVTAFSRWKLRNCAVHFQSVHAFYSFYWFGGHSRSNFINKVLSSRDAKNDKMEHFLVPSNWEFLSVCSKSNRIWIWITGCVRACACVMNTSKLRQFWSHDNAFGNCYFCLKNSCENHNTC